MINKFVTAFVLGKEKAVAGSAVSFFVAFALQHYGWHVSDGLQQSLGALIVGAMTYGVVFFERNSEVQKLVNAADAVMEEVSNAPTQPTAAPGEVAASPTAAVPAVSDPAQTA